MSNLCIECGIDMGECNPRQLCGKTRCLNTGFYSSSSDEETDIYDMETDVEDNEPISPSKKPKLVRRDAEISTQSENNNSNDNINE